jgi:tRNA pseudouridine38-40 synthase
MTALRRIRIIIEFDGRTFSGWQRQARGESVQGSIEKGLAKLLKHPVTLHGAGRTDSGVHALGMAAHFDTPNIIPAKKLPQAVAPWLPREIAVVSAKDVPRDFNARADALMRWYRYQILCGGADHPLGARGWKIRRRLDFEKLERATALFKGKHDFKGFRSAACGAERTMLTMREASITARREIIAIDFKCQSFLMRMVRLMVGAIVMAGEGRLIAEEIDGILKTGQRPSGVRAAPAEGLCLMQIGYNRDEVEAILAAHPAPPSF